MGKEIKNPCVSLCELKSEICVACGRSKEEIKKWKGMKRPEKKATVERAQVRLKSIRKKGR